MAEGKKSFILYANITHTVKKLSRDQVAELFLTILDYVNDENPVVTDLAVDLVFEPIKQQLKIDLKKWDQKKVKNSEAGRKGGIKSGEARRMAEKIEANEANASKTKPRFSVEANEAVNVNVNVNDIVINKGFKDLNEQELNQAFEFMFHLGRKEISKEDIKNFWIAFKTHKPESVSESRGKQMQHFRDWLKFQKKTEVKKTDNQPATVYNIDEQIAKYK